MPDEDELLGDGALDDLIGAGFSAGGAGLPDCKAC